MYCVCVCMCVCEYTVYNEMIKTLAIRKMVAIELEGNAKFDLFQFLLKLFFHIQTLSYTENSKVTCILSTGSSV